MAAIKPGEKFLFQGAPVRIVRLIDLDKIEVAGSNKKPIEVSRKELVQIPEDFVAKNSNEIFALSEKDLALANTRHNTIRPIIASPGDGAVVKKVSRDQKVPVTTLYRWVDLFRKSGGAIESLAEGRGKSLDGRKLLEPALEEIIANAIEKKYLTLGRKSITKVIEEVAVQCRSKKLKPPHDNTIRSRIHDLDEREVMGKRQGKGKAKDVYGDRPGEFPDPVHALQLVQIDHTPIDLILVDPTHNLPLKGRPILTTALDVVTRMIVGYYLSFLKPGFVSAGLCLSHAILEKDKTLKRLKVEGDWPCWGKMAILYMDNAKEFRGFSMAKACDKFLIHTEWRPRKNPRFGGHIESFQKTLNSELHNLPGSTFYSVKHRDNYDSEKMAALTFDELERYIVNFIVNKYHIRLHSELKRPPIAVWKEQIVGNSSTIPGIGYQEPPNEENVKISFLPWFTRTIQNYGVSHETITYYSNTFKPFIRRTERGREKKLKEYEFRYDPRDISHVYFFHPTKKEFEKIDLAKLQYRHLKPSIWEFKAMARALKAQGLREVDEDRIFRGIATANDIEEKAITRKEQIKRDHKKAKKQNSENPVTVVKPKADDDDPFAGMDLDAIKPY
jgi:putative transposase